jgi:hypothetical protein
VARLVRVDDVLEPEGDGGSVDDDPVVRTGAEVHAADVPDEVEGGVVLDFIMIDVVAGAGRDAVTVDGVAIVIGGDVLDVGEADSVSVVAAPGIAGAGAADDDMNEGGRQPPVDDQPVGASPPSMKSAPELGESRMIVSSPPNAWIVSLPDASVRMSGASLPIIVAISNPLDR